jgi:DNA replication and repair protein RecF
MLTKLALARFRGYAPTEAEFLPGISLVEGANGEGKTNLLEAVYLSVTGRSHRAARDREMISFGEDDAAVTAEFALADGRELTHEVRLRREGRRENFRNGLKLRRVSDFSESVSAVMFTPDDLRLVRGGAEERRRMLDLCIAQLRPRYAEALSEHARLYAGKLRILKSRRDDRELLAALPEYNDALVSADARLIYYRASFVKKLAERAAVIHGECSGGETLSAAYKTVAGADENAPDAANIREALAARQRELYSAELDSGAVLVGARRDDVELTLDGNAARRFASQGQTRTIALALKFAERDIMTGETGAVPILLLDDVLSELDGARREYVLDRAGTGQVFISSCERGARPAGAAVYEVAGRRLLRN